ncbi:MULTISPECIES: histidine kinase [Ignavibacterium]|jgi:sensor histidine kinase YesM|uniref:sensor histidine kinase n=1 Tax=Ignavibacterium TaxID=795750 RepID=UPI0025B7DC17|nr:MULTISPECIES: histidine kinase [Ignavibacterium]MBI5662293.1 histidine kinase [Ignavibacterium album]
MFDNPILKRPKNFLLYLLFCGGLSIVYLNLIIFDSKLDSTTTALIDVLVFNLLLTGIGINYWFASKYLSIETTQIHKIIFSHLLGGVFVTLFWLIVGYFISLSLVANQPSYSTFFFNTIKLRVIIGLLHYFLLTAFYYIVIYYSSFQEKLVKETELKNLVTEAELKSLKFQINPHFIFNALNSMSALTEIDPKRAKQMIIKLADFLRYTLANNDRQKNSLSEELKNIKLYLDIEKIRFEDKFEFVEEIDEACKNTEIPSMILQPLFENAIKHAVYETLDKVIIKLNCEPIDNFLKISLTNNFEGESHKKGAGVGLKNIRERLALIYHQDNLLEVKKENGTFTVNIFIPIENK